MPGDGTVAVSGTVGLSNSQDAASTTFDAQLTIKHLDPVAVGFVDPAAGISVIASLDAHIVSDGINVTNDGNIHAEHLVLLKGGKAAPYPVDVTFQVVNSLNDRSARSLISPFRPALSLFTSKALIKSRQTYPLKTPHSQLTPEDKRSHLNANAQSFRCQECRLAGLRVFGYGEIVRHQASCHEGEAQFADGDLAGKGCGKPPLDHRTKRVGVHEEANGCSCE